MRPAKNLFIHLVCFWVIVYFRWIGLQRKLETANWISRIGQWTTRDFEIVAGFERGNLSRAATLLASASRKPWVRFPTDLTQGENWWSPLMIMMMISTFVERPCWRKGENTENHYLWNIADLGPILRNTCKLVKHLQGFSFVQLVKKSENTSNNTRSILLE